VRQVRGGCVLALSIALVTQACSSGEEPSRPESTRSPTTRREPVTTTAAPPRELSVSTPGGLPLAFTAPLPPRWRAIPGPLFVDVGNSFPIPRAEATVATFDVPAEISKFCDHPIAALERLGPTDAVVSVSDSYAAHFLPRPRVEEFLPAPVPLNEVPEGDRDLTPEICLERAPDFRYNQTGFTENWRQVSVFVAIGLNASPTVESEVIALINSLVVNPSVVDK
jgi:hypothetical protein